MNCSVLLALPLLISACAGDDTASHEKASSVEHPIGVERSENLGFGFRGEDRAEATRASCEGLAHYSYLLYGKQELARVDGISISPSGRFAIYQAAIGG